VSLGSSATILAGLASYLYPQEWKYLWTIFTCRFADGYCSESSLPGPRVDRCQDRRWACHLWQCEAWDHV